MGTAPRRRGAARIGAGLSRGGARGAGAARPASSRPSASAIAPSRSARGQRTISISSCSSGSAPTSVSSVGGSRGRLVGEARGRVDRPQQLPARRLHPRLLDQLALGALQLALALDVERAGGDLQQRLLPHRLARLAHQEKEALVVGDDRDRARVDDDLALVLGAVRAPVAANDDVEEVALKGVGDAQLVHAANASEAGRQAPLMAAWASASFARIVSVPSPNSSNGCTSQVTRPNSG